MKTGDYVRTKSGIIGKLIIKEDTIAVAKWQGGYELQDTTTYIINDEKVYKNEIIKSSPNIIDLIEVGDYVNGKKVEWVGYGMYQDTEDGLIGIGDKFILFNEFTKDGAREKDIKSILTKEQFSQMEYKL